MVFSKHFWKFLAGLLGLVGLGLGVIFFFGFDLEEYKARKEARKVAEEKKEFVRELEQKYLDDTYGGQTPEETLELFISAIEAGDLNLAAKYFVLDEQEKWRENLNRIEERNQIDNC